MCVLHRPRGWNAWVKSKKTSANHLALFTPLYDITMVKLWQQTWRLLHKNWSLIILTAFVMFYQATLQILINNPTFSNKKDYIYTYNRINEHNYSCKQRDKSCVIEALDWCSLNARHALHFRYSSPVCQFMDEVNVPVVVSSMSHWASLATARGINLWNCWNVVCMECVILYSSGNKITIITIELLTHLPLVPHICVSELSQHCFR